MYQLRRQEFKRWGLGIYPVCFHTYEQKYQGV